MSPVGLLEPCSLMRRTLDVEERVEPDRSRAAGRRRRLKRGIERWHRDVLWRDDRVHAVYRITLTFTSDQVDAAAGAIRALWHAYRRVDSQPTYFAWLELQRRGAPHYHILLIDKGEPGVPRRPLWRFERDLRRWFTQHWKQHARLQPDIKREEWRWFADRAAKYVTAYAKKIGGKRYQQDYENVPRELRTFVNDRLLVPLSEHAKHETRGIVVCTRPGEPWYVQVENLWLIGHMVHETENRVCSPTPGTKRERRVCYPQRPRGTNHASGVQVAPVAAKQPSSLR